MSQLEIEVIANCKAGPPRPWPLAVTSALSTEHAAESSSSRARIHPFQASMAQKGARYDGVAHDASRTRARRHGF